ncbi:hypothetical protein [Halococcoides cellulosivorans]|uniref:Uncharacterized protein n=1 Tax=Halococcoides cellulosivorans TaxID=1679096 RepID=A0A2R4X462_9EURY|nr:hypothetical protein [Halococcoides cellulosivorans]AWB28493.1 hypothetical protein HARCEL1_12675 [Halococcoides cellulosivorans]
MLEEELIQTTMMLSERHREVLDAESGSSRTAVVRDLIDNLEAAREGSVEGKEDPDICPVCGRTADAVILGDIVDLRAIDDESLSVCEESDTVNWLYIHRLDA